MTLHDAARLAYALDPIVADQIDDLAKSLGEGDEHRARVACELLLHGEAFVCYDGELFNPAEVTVLATPGASQYRVRYEGRVYSQHEVLHLARRVRERDLRGTSPLPWLLAPVGHRGPQAWMRKRVIAKVRAELARLEAE